MIITSLSSMLLKARYEFLLYLVTLFSFAFVVCFSGTNLFMFYFIFFV